VNRRGASRRVKREPEPSLACVASLLSEFSVSRVVWSSWKELKEIPSSLNLNLSQTSTWDLTKQQVSTLTSLYSIHWLTCLALTGKQRAVEPVQEVSEIDKPLPSLAGELSLEYFPGYRGYLRMP